VIYTVACKEGIFVAVIWNTGPTGTGGQGRVKGGSITVARNMLTRTLPNSSEFVSRNDSVFKEIS